MVTITRNQKIGTVVGLLLLVIFHPTGTRLGLVVGSVAVAATAHYLAQHTDAVLQRPLRRAAQWALAIAALITLLS